MSIDILTTIVKFGHNRGYLAERKYKEEPQGRGRAKALILQ